MAATDFCTIYLALCLSGRDAASPDTASCMTRYDGSFNTVITANGSVAAWDSYHICNAYNSGAPSAATEATHCPTSKAWRSACELTTTRGPEAVRATRFLRQSLRARFWDALPG